MLSLPLLLLQLIPLLLPLNSILIDSYDLNSTAPSSSSTVPPPPVNNFKQRQKTSGCVVASSRSYCLPNQRELRRKISQKNIKNEIYHIPIIISFTLQLYPIPLQTTPMIHSKIFVSNISLSIPLKKTTFARIEADVGVG